MSSSNSPILQANALIVEADKHIDKKKYEQAIECYDRALKFQLSTSRYATIYFNRGECKAVLSQKKSKGERDRLLNEAWRDFEAAIRFHPQFILAHISLVKLIYYNYTVASHHHCYRLCKKTISIILVNEKYDFLPQMEKDLGPYLKEWHGLKNLILIAIDELHKVYTLSQDEVLELRIELYQACLNRDHALGKTMLKGSGALSLQNNDDLEIIKRINHALAVNYTVLGKKTKDIGHFKTAIEYNRSYGDAWFELAQAYDQKSEWQLGKEAYAQALRSYTFLINENDGLLSLIHKPVSYFNRGMVYLNMQLYASAFIDFYESLHLGATNHQARQRLQEIFDRTLNVEKEKELILDMNENVSLKILWGAITYLDLDNRLKIYDQCNFFYQKLDSTADNDLLQKINRSMGEDYKLRADRLYRESDSRADTLSRDNDRQAAIIDYHKALNHYPDLDAAMQNLERAEKGLFFQPVKTGYISQFPQYEKKKEKATKTTAHAVFKHKIDGRPYWFKVAEKNQPYMAYIAAYFNYRYRMMFLGRVAPDTACVDNAGNLIGENSKGAPDFTTLYKLLQEKIKENGGDVQKGEEAFVNWFRLQLKDEITRKEFLQLLSAAWYLCEDDLTPNNIGVRIVTDPDGVERLHFFLFDTDCAGWPITYRFKGKRKGVDGTCRDPETAFDPKEEHFVNFPNVQGTAHYNPGVHTTFLPGVSKDNVANIIVKGVVEHYTTNFFPEKFVDMVKEMGLLDPFQPNRKSQDREISYAMCISQILLDDEDICSIAKLIIPEDAMHNGENVIQTIIQFEKKRRQAFWKGQIGSADFRRYLASAADLDHPGLYASFLMCDWINRDLQRGANKHPGRKDEYEAACLSPNKMAENYNKLLRETSEYEKNNCKTNRCHDQGFFFHRTEPSNPYGAIDCGIFIANFGGNIHGEVDKGKTEYNNWINSKKGVSI